MRLCGCMLDVGPGELLHILQNTEIDLVEWRLDAFLARYGQFETLDMLAVLGSTPRLPVLVTNRPKRQGGFYEGDESQRLEILARAVKLGAEWVDLEGDVDRGWCERLRGLGARVLVSHHEFSHTPENVILQDLARELAVSADGIKIVTTAERREDCLRVLDLIPWGRDALQVEVMAFCMGAPGRWSRVASLLLGSPWAYVRLAGGTEAAPGQYTAAEMRTLLEGLR